MAMAISDMLTVLFPAPWLLYMVRNYLESYTFMYIFNNSKKIIMYQVLMSALHCNENFWNPVFDII